MEIILNQQLKAHEWLLGRVEHITNYYTGR